MDDYQRHAAENNAPAQLTLAGPGSGKTTTLTGRYIHLVKQGVSHRSIIATTFTKKAAEEMAKRISERLGIPSEDVKRLNIGTFHGLCYRWLRRNPGVAGFAEQFPIIDTPKQRRIFTERRMWWNEDEDILDIITGAKERMISVDAFPAWAEEGIQAGVMQPYYRQAVEFYRVYQSALTQIGAADFSDLIWRSADTMARNEGFRRGITGNIEHVLVDEYQDVNPAQICLIDQLIRDGAHLWAVGDDDQTLYAFRAANIEYILNFDQRHPGAIIHNLQNNYRSVPQIVCLGQELICHNQARRKKVLKPIVSDAGCVTIRGYSTAENEARQVARAIRQLLDEQWFPVKEIAILYRTSTVGLEIQGALKDADVPFQVRGGGDIWNGVAGKLFVGSLMYLRNPSDVEAMSRLGGGKRAEIIISNLNAVRQVVANDFQLAVTHVSKIVGAAKPAMFAARQAAEWKASVDAVAALARRSGNVDDLLERIAERSSALRKGDISGVVLSTVHSAKGLEWDVVFIIGMEDGTLPSAYAENAEEERRVAYVGITRARRLLGMTYARNRFGETLKPSSFLFEMTKSLDRRSFIWTGFNKDDADERLPIAAARRWHPSDNMGSPPGRAFTKFAPDSKRPLLMPRKGNPSPSLPPPRMWTHEETSVLISGVCSNTLSIQQTADKLDRSLDSVIQKLLDMHHISRAQAQRIIKNPHLKIMEVRQVGNVDV